MGKTFITAAVASLLAVASTSVQAGPVFLTGHDPDFHAQISTGAQNLLNIALKFVTNGTYKDGTHKFLWVESTVAPPSGHLVGENGLLAIGLTAGVNFDTATGAQFVTADLSQYTAIVIASDFGGLLTSAEIGALNARSIDIKNFINGGGGLFAAAECAVGNPACLADLVTSSDKLFGFLPITAISSVTAPPYTVTAYGASLGLTNGDVNDATHNSFASAAGLNIIDLDAAGNPTTLAGNVKVGGGGFVPEPSSVAIFGAGSLLLAARARRRR